jgi:hypothetical protein
VAQLNFCSITRDCFCRYTLSPATHVEESGFLSVGLIALLDDIAAIAKMAAASLGDAAAQAAKAGGKAAGVVIDDAAVTPRYVLGFAPKRELPIVGRIAAGSLRNKLFLLLPATLARSDRRDQHRYRPELVSHRWPESARCHRAAAEVVTRPPGHSFRRGLREDETMMEDRSSRRMRTLVAQMARSRPVR